MPVVARSGLRTDCGSVQHPVRRAVPTNAGPVCHRREDFNTHDLHPLWHKHPLNLEIRRGGTLEVRPQHPSSLVIDKLLRQANYRELQRLNPERAERLRIDMEFSAKRHP